MSSTRPTEFTGLNLMAPEPGANLREQIQQRMRSNVISGRSPPGTIFSVPQLAQELGVSTTPVREALLDLARDGLITPLRNRGFRVEPMSVSALDNLFAMRSLLETHAAVFVAQQGIADATELEQLAEAVRKAVRNSDLTAYLTTDRAFHTAFVNEARNPLLTKLVLQLRDDMRLYGIDSPEGRQRQRDSVDEHFQLVELAVKHDTEAIAPLMQKHILSWKPLFIAALTAQPAPGVAPIRST